MTRQLTRRSVLLGGSITLGALTGIPLLASCAGGQGTGGQGGAKSTTLAVPFLADMQVPDPDVFYEGEGLLVTTSLYEGLIAYAAVPSGVVPEYSPENRFEPLLAQRWQVSPDGLEYTFNLRDDVKFHDGTPMDAEAWRASFARRTAVNAGPAYMLANVASTAAPDPKTFVVRLKTPTAAFLDYLAGPWGPKAVSPTAVKEHAKGDDHAQEWLSTHSAGTGSYSIQEFLPSSTYTLAGFNEHWSGAPHFDTLRVEVTPDVQTQELKLRNGEFDMITKGLVVDTINSFAKDPAYQVQHFSLALKLAMVINPQGVFSDKAARQALRSAIDRKAVLDGSYKDTATLSTQFYPVACFPTDAAADNPPLNPEQLKAMIAGLPSRDVSIAVAAELGAAGMAAGQLIQVQLQQLGLNATARSIPSSEQFAMYEHPAKGQPDLLLAVQGGDVMHPDNVLRAVWRTDAGPLNYYNWSIPAVDKLMDEGSASLDPKASLSAYQRAAEILMDEAVNLNLFDLRDNPVVRSGITDFVHDPMTEWTFRMGQLNEANS